MESPVYIQIHNQLKKDIEAGKWSIGDRIPSERELALNFEVSRMTLRQAVQTLVDEAFWNAELVLGLTSLTEKSKKKCPG